MRSVVTLAQVPVEITQFAPFSITHLCVLALNKIREIPLQTVIQNLHHVRIEHELDVESFEKFSF